MSVSLKDVAARAGVSSVAVSLALRGDPRISEARRIQIRSIAEEIGYRPNPFARAMRTRRSQTVGLLLADLRTATSNLKIEAIEQRMVRHGHQLLLGFTGADEQRLFEYIDSMIARQADGLIVFGPHGKGSGAGSTWRRLRDRLSADAPPVVLADVQSITKGHFRQVGVDRGSAAGAAVNHLLHLGHRNLMYVGPSGGSSLEKWRGVLAQSAKGIGSTARIRFAPLDGGPFLDAADAPRRPGAVCHLDNGSVAAVLDCAGRVSDRIAELRVDHRPTALIAASDLIAMSLIGRLHEHDIVVPRDMSVIGFDGDEIARRVFRPRLTTMQQPQDVLADRVVQTLIDAMAGRRILATTELVEATLVVGESTAPPPGQ